MTERLDLTASRNESWRPTLDYVYEGDPLPIMDATARMQWRLYEGAAGDPIADIDVPFEDILATMEDVTLGVARAGDRILRFFPALPLAFLQAMPSGLNQPEPGEADRYVFDIVLTYADATADRLIAGFVFLDKGTTIDAA